MLMLIAGLVIFVAAHSVPMVPGLRETLVRPLGEIGFKAAFSSVSLAGFVLIIYGKGSADFVPLWWPPAPLRYLTSLLTLLAFISVAAAYLPNNFRRVTAHPMLWGVTLWAGGHLLSNGDLAAVLLFGAFLAYALVAMWSANRRGARPRTAVVAHGWDAAAVGTGVALYAVVFIYHATLFGVAVVP